jgi:PST family polysaccharide transporter
MNANQVMEPTANNSIGRQASRGLRWSLLGMLATKLGSFTIGLVLARLLTPADFGLYAIALAATGFVMHVNDAGIIAATVQWRGRLEAMAPTAATIAVLFSVAAYGIMWIVAPSFAELAGSPEATPVVRLLTVVILIDGVTAVRSAALMRRFQQDKLTMANVAGLVVQAPLAIALAMVGAGAFSFAIGQVAGALVTGVLVFVFAKVPVKVGFDRAIAGRLFRFGVPLAASLGVEAILVNADYVIVGRLMGATALGFYLLAFNVSTWVLGVIIAGVRYVSIPAFSRLAEQKGSLSVGVQRSVPLLIAVAMPFAVLTATLAPALVMFLYGDTWAPAVPVLRFLMILSVVRVLTSFTVDILTSVGATRATFWLNLGWAAALIPALFVSTSVAGIRGAAMGHALVALLVALPLAILLLHRAGVQLAPIGSALVRPLLGCALAATVCLLTMHVVEGSSFVQLSIAGSAGLVTYALIVVPRENLRRWRGRAGALISVRRADVKSQRPQEEI